MTKPTALLLVTIVAVSVLSLACGGPTAPSNTEPWSFTDVQEGTGTAIANGSKIKVYYTGWLYDSSKTDKKGVEFDTGSIGSADTPLVVGNRMVVQGFDDALPGMKQDGIRRVIVPPSLAYGNTRSGIIPPNATLVFEITLKAIY